MCVYNIDFLLLQSWKWASEKHNISWIILKIILFLILLHGKTFKQWIYINVFVYNEFKNNFIQSKTDKETEKMIESWIMMETICIKNYLWSYYSINVLSTKGKFQTSWK